MSDKTGTAYWEAAYTGGAYRSTRLDFDPDAPGLRNHWKRQFHAYFAAMFARAFGDAPLAGRRLLEVGCGASAFLPYFARRFGFAVGGVDYSPTGCAMAVERLEQAGVTGDVVLADVFAPPERLVGSADVVVSFGVVEHFEDTAACVRACARLLRPGGLMITTVPYMGGLTGWLQHRLDRRVFDAHQRLTPALLGRAHAAAGLEVLDARLAMFANFGVVNVGPERPRAARAAHQLLRGATAALWAAEAAAPGLLRPNLWTSPYTFCAARVPGGGPGR